MTLDEILSDLYLRLHTADEARDLIDGIMWREINAHVAAEREALSKKMDAIAQTCREENSDYAPFEYAAAVIRARGEK